MTITIEQLAALSTLLEQLQAWVTEPEARLSPPQTGTRVDLTETRGGCP